jgi:hypothetical protein
VQVLDREDDRPLPAALQAPCVQSLERAQLDALRTQVSQTVRAVGDTEKVQQVGSVTVRLQPDLLQAETDLVGHRRRRVPILDSAVRPHKIQDRQVRDAAAIGKAASLQVGDVPVAQAASELVQQSRLADAGLTDHPHDLAMPSLHLRERAAQRG